MRALLIVLIAFSLFACGDSTSSSSSSTGNSAATQDLIAKYGELESPNITIELEGQAAGPAYIIATLADQRYRLDSSAVDETGKVVFQRPEPYPPGYMYGLLPNNTVVQFLVDKDQTFTLKSTAVNTTKNMVVEGSIDNELFYKNMSFDAMNRPAYNMVNKKLRETANGTKEFEDLLAQRETIANNRKVHLEELYAQAPNSFFTSFKKAGQNPEIEQVFKADGVTLDTLRQAYLFRTKLWDNVDFTDVRLLNTPVIANKLKRHINELTPQHPDSITNSADALVAKVLDQPDYYKFFVNWITLNYEPTKTTLMDPEAVFVNMIQKYFTYDRAFWSDSTEVFALQQRAYEMAASLVGKKGPDVISTDPSGQQKSIYGVKSPYIVVYMFNPQCEHCAEETPKLVEWIKTWKSKGAEVFAIAIDTDDAEWRQYLTKNNMQAFTNVFDATNKSIYAKYFVDNTPEIYVLNPERTIIAKNLKVEQIATVINRDKARR